MFNNKLDNDECKLYECDIKYNNNDGKLLLTNNNMIFLREKGIFVKKLRIDKKILINSIKMYKDDVLIKQNFKTVTMQTTNGEVVFEGKNILDANKIVNKIKDIRTGVNGASRIYKKYNNFKNTELGNALIYGGLGFVATHPKKTVKVVKGIAKGIKFLFVRR